LENNINDWSSFFNGWSIIKTIKIQYDFLNEIINFTNKDSFLLELGSGSGLSSLSLFFSDRKNILVSDIDEKVLININKSIPFLNTKNIDMFNIQISKKIDCIFHQGLMEHFSDEDIIRSLTEQSKFAKLIIFDIPNNRRFTKVQEFGNERFLSVRKWSKLIRKSNLRIIKISGRRLPKFLNFLQNNYFIKKFFGTSSIFVCKSLNEQY